MKKDPKDLQEAIEAYMATVSEDDKIYISTLTEKEFISTQHHTSGQYIRNTWGLWFNDTEIGQWFSALGINHADDRSGIILASVYRTIMNRPIELGEQVHHYIEFWKKHGFDNGIHPINKH
jgi:hypothetical protein